MGRKSLMRKQSVSIQHQFEKQNSSHSKFVCDKKPLRGDFLLKQKMKTTRYFYFYQKAQQTLDPNPQTLDPRTQTPGPQNLEDLIHLSTTNYGQRIFTLPCPAGFTLLLVSTKKNVVDVFIINGILVEQQYAVTNYPPRPLQPFLREMPKLGKSKQ